MTGRFLEKSPVSPIETRGAFVDIDYFFKKTTIYS